MKAQGILTICALALTMSSCGGSGSGPVAGFPPFDDDAPVQAAAVVAGYYPNWTSSPVRIRDVDADYNLIYLFHGQPVGGAPGTTGAIHFDFPGDGRGAATNLRSDIQYARSVQGRKIMLTAGGADNGMSFPNRAKSQAFLDSVIAIYDDLGGFDGLDWNTYEADQNPDTDEIIWISQQLKNRYPGFMITTPPAPWRERDMTFCAALLQAGVLDYAAPQYYDGPGLDDVDYVVDNVAQWVALLGAERVVVGFGIADAANYMNVDEAKTAWNRIKTNHPSIRGVFNWQIHADEAAGWAFADTLGPLVRSD